MSTGASAMGMWTIFPPISPYNFCADNIKPDTSNMPLILILFVTFYIRHLIEMNHIII